MDENNQVFERYAFFSSRKEREVLQNVLETVFTLPVDSIALSLSDQPNETFSSLNERTKKILLGHPRPDKIEKIGGEFSDGGSFELERGILQITISAEQYNFEVVDAMKRFLSPVFPLCVFRNPYIWGVDLYADYDRELLFATRVFTVRSPHLEEPEIDIFRRDDGVIFKLRFHLREDLPFEDGRRFLAPLYEDLLESLRKRAYEGLEVLHLYCSDRVAFRRMEARTKLGKEIKSSLTER